jgi:hypothetical protein
MVKCGVYFAVRTEFLNVICTSTGFRWVTVPLCVDCGSPSGHLHDSPTARSNVTPAATVGLCVGADIILTVSQVVTTVKLSMLLVTPCEPVGGCQCSAEIKCRDISGSTGRKCGLFCAHAILRVLKISYCTFMEPSLTCEANSRLGGNVHKYYCYKIPRSNKINPSIM